MWLDLAILAAQVGVGPVARPLPPPIPEPADKPFRGEIRLSVEATDTAHGVFHVSEVFPVQSAGEITLLYPEWETTSHAPTASAVELAGLHIRADGQELVWRRDSLDVHAFHVTPPPTSRTLLINFDYLSQGSTASLRPGLINVQWQRLLLYPAGWYARDIAVSTDLHLPTGLRAFSALMPVSKTTGATLSLAPETLDRLVDAPLYAARFTQQYELASGGAPVHLDLLTDVSDNLALTLPVLTEAREMVRQAGLVFGAPPFRHYDALVSLSDDFSPGGGLEHLEEGENNLPANYLTAGAQQLNNDDLIAHEYVHAWNGRYRQPAALWSPNFNRPTDPSLLWVYEGQTEFWGRVLAARCGMRTLQETFDKLALDASLVANRPGREWKTLGDSTLDALYMPGHPVSWRDWQRREDYYSEGVLLWLDVDARLRELTRGRSGLDDFAHRFFKTRGRTPSISTYTFEDVCATLNLVAKADWASFLDRHIVTHDTGDALAGLRRAGWQLVFTAVPTETFLQTERETGVVNLDASIGAQLRMNGSIRSVVWDGPAFRAGLAPGMRVMAVNGHTFAPEVLTAAVADSDATPMRLAVEHQDAVVILRYAGPLRYPHLTRIPDLEDRLTPLLTPR